MLAPETHSVTLSGGLLQRGFWIYVWRVTDAGGRQWLYVGRTGDNSSPYAAPPYQRLGQHLGHMANTNALRSRLAVKGVDVDACQSFEMISYGPVYAEVERPDGFQYGDKEMCARLFEQHRPLRDRAGALERDLHDAFLHSKLGDQVVNTVKWKKQAPPAERAAMLAAFVAHFPELKGVE